MAGLGTSAQSPARIAVTVDLWPIELYRTTWNKSCAAVFVRGICSSGMGRAWKSLRQRIASQRALADIHRHFPDWKTVAAYTPTEVQNILADRRMIRHPGKIQACVNNAKQFATIIRERGSLQAYIDSFKAADNPENLTLLKQDLQARFAYLGRITVYHFMTDIGLPVLKPDRVVSRIFTRLGVTNDETDLVGTVMAGQQFAKAAGLPIRYIDIVFVALGQAQSLDFGMDRGIRLKKPRCEVCGLTPSCRYYRENA